MPAGRPTVMEIRSTGPAVPSTSTCSPCSRWWGPQVKAMATQARPKWDRPRVSQWRRSSAIVISP